MIQVEKIAFNRPYLRGKEKEYLLNAFEQESLQGDGYYTKKVSDFLQKNFAFSHVLMTTSGSHALELAVQTAGLGPGDEVIMPSFTFTSTANAVLNQGATPVFAELKSDTLNLDPTDLLAKITKRTKAVIPVHYGGIVCEMKKINAIAHEHNLIVIEDAAHALNSSYYGKAAGSLGDFGCFSFHASKNFCCGEGGALVINSQQPELWEKAEIIREKGTNRSQFLRGEIYKYSWISSGSSYLPADILMALLLGQLENKTRITYLREKIHKFYFTNLQEFLTGDLLQGMSFIPEGRSSNYHIFFLRVKNKRLRDYILQQLKEAGISATFHFQPLHASKMGAKLGYKAADLPLSNEAAQTLIRLPIYPDLTKSAQTYIISKLRDIFLNLQRAGA